MLIKHTDHSADVASFAQRNPGWNGFHLDAVTMRAVMRACVLGCIEINAHCQFRSVYSNNEPKERKDAPCVTYRTQDL